MAPAGGTSPGGESTADSGETALAALARAAGLATSYVDTTGTERAADPETLLACLAALGLDVSTPKAIADSLAEEEARDASKAGQARPLPGHVVAEPGRPVPLDLDPALDWVLHQEDGQSAEGCGPLPGLPLGRHRLDTRGETVWIFSAPSALPLPAPGWGVTLPLYGLRTEAEGGIGDYADLARAAGSLGRAGADFLGLNPVHAGFPGNPALISPYTPSHRRRLSVSNIHAPGEAATPSGPLIDYARSRVAKMAALEHEFAAAGDDPGFGAFLAEGGDALRHFAIYEALAERHGPTWDRWAEDLRDRDSAAVAAFAGGAADRVRFHSWLQYRAEAQLAAAAEAARRAGMAHGLYLDLAVGTHPHGAETWAEPTSFASGVSLGAPPDAFSAEGQNWALAPFNPRALAADGFAAFAATLRAQLAHAGMLRIDHALGFERAFWVPDGGPGGTYVRMPKDALLAVTRIEAARAGAVIVGEDLGNIPKGLGEDLASSHILGCDVVQFMPDRAGAAYREAALASFGTHDLPTWEGWRRGRDIELRRGLGLMDETDAARAMAARETDVARFGQADADAMHGFLAGVRARLVAVQIEDALGLEDQPNLPGTVDAYPNWRRRLPVAAGALGADSRLARVAAIMAAAGRGGGGSGAGGPAGV